MGSRQSHSINCTGHIEWENMKTIKVEPNRFDRKVRRTRTHTHTHLSPGFIVLFRLILRNFTNFTNRLIFDEFFTDFFPAEYFGC